MGWRRAVPTCETCQLPHHELCRPVRARHVLPARERRQLHDAGAVRPELDRFPPLARARVEPGEEVAAIRPPAGRSAAPGLVLEVQQPEPPVRRLSLIHISEPTRLGMISYA